MSVVESSSFLTGPLSSPYYEDDLVTLFHGDCLDILPSLGDSSFDAVLTDPPYNFGFDYGGHDDAMTVDDYGSWCAEWFAECRRLALRVVVFPGHGNLPMWWDIGKPSGVGVWYKPGNPKGAGVFQFCEWEPFLLYGKGVGGSDVIRATVTRQMDTGDHPCPKPLRLFQELVKKSKAQSVLDPFAGSGTTLAAAKYLGVRAVGVEMNEAYCEIAAKRLTQDTLFGVEL
jgi:DNA modification methylase